MKLLEHEDITLWKGDDYTVILRTIVFQSSENVDRNGKHRKFRINHCICIDKDGHLVWQDNKPTEEVNSDD